MTRFPPLPRVGVLLVALVVLAGCQRYQLQGRVVQGPASSIAVVDAEDARLNQPGLGKATLHLTIDPESIGKRHALDPVAVGPDGSFAIPLEELGAGFLMYDLGVVARSPGHKPVESVVSLPPASKRLLIILEPGADRYRAPEDPFENVDHFMNQMRQ